MKPLDRRGFLLATLCSLVSLALIVLHVRTADFWSEWLEITIGRDFSPADLVRSFLFAVLFVICIWCWFVARRFLALSLARWTAVLPALFWTLAMLPLLTVSRLADPQASFDPQLDLREFRTLEYVSYAVFSFVAASILTAAWCAARALQRDPFPVEDHFT